jgi:transposase
MSCADAGLTPVRRFEVFTGSGRRRSWTMAEKAAIVAESYSEAESVCAVARRHGLRHTQLFTWRRELRQAVQAAGSAPPTAVPTPLFVPAVLDPAPPPAPGARRQGAAAFLARPVPPAVTGCRRARDRWRAGTDRAGRRRGDHRRRGRGAQRRGVIGPGPPPKVLIATEPVDFRKGMDGLAALVQAELGADPFSGVVYVFRAKRADRVKLVRFDGTGLCLMHKRLETGAFRWPRVRDGVMRLSAAQLSALIEGLDWRRVHAPRAVRRQQLA